MARRRRLLVGCLGTAVALLGGCGVALLALMPGAGPPMLAALAPDADVLVHAREVDALVSALEGSERFARFREGPAWKALAESEAGRALARALDSAERSGFSITRSRASHLVGREVGAAVWLDPSGGVRAWVAAFRIDTAARIAELAGRLSQGDRVSSAEEAAETV